jgi:hypothetical protein
MEAFQSLHLLPSKSITPFSPSSLTAFGPPSPRLKSEQNALIGPLRMALRQFDSSLAAGLGRIGSTASRSP